MLIGKKRPIGIDNMSYELLQLPRFGTGIPPNSSGVTVPTVVGIKTPGGGTLLEAPEKPDVCGGGRLS